MTGILLVGLSWLSISGTAGPTLFNSSKQIDLYTRHKRSNLNEKLWNPSGDGNLRTIHSLREATNLAPLNTWLACDAQEGENLDKFGKNKIATGPISWNLLRAISEITPVESYARRLLLSGEEFASAFVPGQDVSNILEQLECMVWGEAAVGVGFLWLLVLVLAICPLLLCSCTRSCCCQGSHKRDRTRQVCSLTAFWIPWALGLLFTVGLVYYSAWIDPDFNAMVCKPMKTSSDLLVDGINLDGHYFAGLVKSEQKLDQIIWALDDLYVEASLNPVSDTKVLLERSLTHLWLPTSSFSGFWRETNVTWTAQGQEVSYSGEVFQMQLLGNELIDPLLNPDSTKYVYNQAIQSSAINWDGTAVMDAISSVRDGVMDAHTQLTSDVTSSILELYNSLVEMLNLLFDQRHWVEVGYTVLMCLVWLPSIGLALSLLLYIQYLRKDFNESAKSAWIVNLAGLLVFGFSIAGIFLFLVGGGVLAVGYFLSDSCRALETVLVGNDHDLVQAFFGYGYDPVIVDKCIKTDASGDIIPGKAQSDWQPIENAMQQIQSSLDPNSFRPDRLGNGVEVMRDSFHPYVIPVLPTDADITSDPAIYDLFRTSLNYEPVTLDQSAASLLSSQPQWKDWMIQNFDTLPGVKTLIDTIGEYQPSCSVCIHPYCTGGEVLEISPETVRAILPGEMANLVASRNVNNIIDALDLGTASETMSYFSWCSPSDVLRNKTWWWSIYVLTIRSYALYEHWNAAGFTHGLPSLANSPLFFHLSQKSDPSGGVIPVSHHDWTQAVVGDVNAIVDFHSSSNFASRIISSAYDQHPLTSLEAQYDELLTSFDCKAVSLGVEDIKDAICDSFAADVVSAATFAVWLGVIHFIAFVICIHFWLARRRARDMKEFEPRRGSEAVSELAMAYDGPDEQNYIAPQSYQNQYAADNDQNPNGIVLNPVLLNRGPSSDDSNGDWQEMSQMNLTGGSGLRTQNVAAVQHGMKEDSAEEASRTNLTSENDDALQITVSPAETRKFT